jgi:hypothetical protein
MTDNSNGRAKAAEEAMAKTPEQLVTWAVERDANDSLRQSIVKLEFERRVAQYTQASSRYMRWSVIVLVASAVATLLFAAWDHYWQWKCHL